MVLGIAVIGFCFVIQRWEDEKRMAGYYTTATIGKIIRGKDSAPPVVQYDFTMDFHPMSVLAPIDAAKAERLTVGRKTLIVYQADSGKLFHNPMEKYRKAQGILLMAGLSILLLGISLTLILQGR